MLDIIKHPWYSQGMENNTATRTYRHYHDNPAAALELIRDLISPAPEKFISEQAAIVFGDLHGTFEEKQGEGADDIVDVRALQCDLAAELNALDGVA